MNSIDEVIAEIRTDLKWVKKELCNHLHQHWAVTLALVTIVGGLVVALLIK